jgi:hypothetical protein
MIRLRLPHTALAAAVVLCGGSARAEMQKFMTTCGGQLCPYFQLALTPPDGWIIDKDATSKNKVQILVPKGESFGTAPALIYVQVFYHADKQQSLADFASVSNARWLAAVSNAKTSPLPPVERANGKPAFLRFAFQNPNKAQQAYEFGAFGTDSDKDGNEYVLDVVLTGGARQALDRADKDYVAFLKAN